MNKLIVWVLCIVFVVVGSSLIFQGSTTDKIQAEVTPSAYAGYFRHAGPGCPLEQGR